MTNVIEKFYTAFKALDAETMCECYVDDIVFEDPAFGQLKGDKAKNMWRMLCQSQKGKDFRIEFSDIQYEIDKGRAHWEAYYTFSKTNRNVHNIIDAEFIIRGNKIVQHVDRFDLYRWSRQAVGIPGYLIGWTPFFKRKLNKQTHKMLLRFEESRRRGFDNVKN